MIVDDEVPAAKVIDRYIRQIPGMEVAAICKNAMEAIQLLNSTTIDLVFLDIQMPGITGLELVKTLNHSVPVILTTAYRDYAVEGFELNVLDYLVKPISFERFFKAIGKVYQTGNLPVNTPASWQENPGHGIMEFKSFDEMYLYVRVDKKMKRVWLRDIVYIESMGDYVKIFTNQEMIITYLKIGYLEKKLPQEHFLRIHRSYLIAPNQVSAFTTNTLEIGQKTLPIGGSYKKNTHKRLEIHLA